MLMHGRPFPVLLMTVVFLCGGSSAAQDTGRWSTAAPMLSERSEVAVAQVAGKVFVVGGFGGQRAIEIYVPAQNHWSNNEEKSVHGSCRDEFPVHVTAPFHENRLYVPGGEHGKNRFQIQYIAGFGHRDHFRSALLKPFSLKSGMFLRAEYQNLSVFSVPEYPGRRRSAQP